MLIHQQKLKHVFKDCQFKAGQYIIKPKYVTKTLGYDIRSDWKLDSDIGKMCSNLNYRINKINQIKKYTNFETICRPGGRGGGSPSRWPSGDRECLPSGWKGTV